MKGLRAVISIAFSIFAISAFGQTKQAADSTSITPNELGDRIIDYAKTFLGKPYSSGGNGPERFDCSGFTSYVYNHFGYKLGRSSTDQAKNGKAVTGDLSKLQKGDILIYGGHRRTIGHVGLFVEMDPSGNSFTFIHAAHDGIRYSHSDETYYKSRFRGARRIIPDFVNTSSQHSETAIAEALAAAGDTIVTSERIILLSPDGTWKMTDSEGKAMAMKDTTIVLGPDGKWNVIKNSKVSIPEIPQNAAEVTENKSASTQAQPQYYKVKSGDTLSRIAVREHTTIKKLCTLNKIKETTVLQIGQKLRVR